MRTSQRDDDDRDDDADWLDEYDPDGLIRARFGASSYEEDQTKALIAEHLVRQRETLRLYRPTEIQERYHSSKAKEVLFKAGNQVGKALRDDQQVLTPNGWVAICELSVGDEVIGGDGNPCFVTGVFPQGVKDLWRVTFDDGMEVVCCDEHLWKCRQTKKDRFRGGDWAVRSLAEILEFGGESPPPTKRTVVPYCGSAQFSEWPIPLDPYLLGVLIGDGSISAGGLQFTTADQELVDEVAKCIPASAKLRAVDSAKYAYSISSRLPAYGTVNRSHSRQNPVIKALRELKLWGTRSNEKFVPACYLWNAPEIRLGILQGLLDTDGTVGEKNGSVEFCTTSRQLANDVEFIVRSLGGSATIKWRQTSFTDGYGNKKHGKPSARVRIRLHGVRLFRLSRKQSRVRYERVQAGHVMHEINPAGRASCTCITVSSLDATFVTEGFVVTHNSIAGFVEVARAVTGQDPHDKYPKKDGVAVCVGFKEKDIGVNIYPYLFEPGCGGRLFVLKNRKTDQWELFEPWNMDHVLQQEQRELAGPLIPPRFIRKFAWHKSGKRVFYSVDFITGWRLYAFSSTAEPTGGFQANLVHIDEDLSRDDWYAEMIARLTIRKGLMRWTALPLSRNDAMLTLQDRAEAESLKPNPATIVVTATVFDNPYMDQETREHNIRIWKSEGEDVYRQRALGEETIESILMYPAFSRITHSAWRDDFSEGEHKALEILRDNQGVPPRDWMRSMVVDPGHTVCSIQYIATAPPSLDSLRVVYDEDYIQQATAPIFGERAQAKVRDYCFQRFIMDMHGGRLRSLDTGLSPAEAYTRELEKRSVRCVETGSRFRAGSDNVRGREESLRQWLAVQRNGLPTVLVVVQRCPNLVREIARFRKKVIDGVTQDEGNRRQNTHAVECLEYAAADGLTYIAPHVEGMERSANAMRLHRGIQHRLRKSQMKKTGAMAATGFSFSRGE